MSTPDAAGVASCQLAGALREYGGLVAPPAPRVEGGANSRSPALKLLYPLKSLSPSLPSLGEEEEDCTDAEEEEGAGGGDAGAVPASATATAPGGR